MALDAHSEVNPAPRKTHGSAEPPDLASESAGGSLDKVFIKRWPLLAAFAIGLLAGALAVLGITAYVDRSDRTFETKTGPGAARWHCSEAEVVVTAVYNEQGGYVELLVSLEDKKRRTWELRESPYYPRTVVTPAHGGTYPQTRLADGDLDGGPTRRLSLRAVDTSGWCEGQVSLR